MCSLTREQGPSMTTDGSPISWYGCAAVSVGIHQLRRHVRNDLTPNITWLLGVFGQSHRGLTGIMNFTNPGAISHNEVWNDESLPLRTRPHLIWICTVAEQSPEGHFCCFVCIVTIVDILWAAPWAWLLLCRTQWTQEFSQSALSSSFVVIPVRQVKAMTLMPSVVE